MHGGADLSQFMVYSMLAIAKYAGKYYFKVNSFYNIFSNHGLGQQLICIIDGKSF